MRAVVATVTETPPAAKVLLIPYARFPCPDSEVESSCTFPSLLQYATELEAMAADFATVTFVNTLYYFGGSETETSNRNLWDDCIHF